MGIQPKSRKAVETPSKTPPPRLPSNVVLGSDPISVSSQKYAPPAKYNEVPFFADLVAAGKLPPISERLPLEPFVVGPGVLNSEQWLDWEVGSLRRHHPHHQPQRLYARIGVSNGYDDSQGT